MGTVTLTSTASAFTYSRAGATMAGASLVSGASVGAGLLTAVPTVWTKPPNPRTTEDRNGPTPPLPAQTMSAPSTTIDEPSSSLATRGRPRRRSSRRYCPSRAGDGSLDRTLERRQRAFGAGRGRTCEGRPPERESIARNCRTKRRPARARSRSPRPIAPAAGADPSGCPGGPSGCPAGRSGPRGRPRRGRLRRPRPVPMRDPVVRSRCLTPLSHGVPQRGIEWSPETGDRCVRPRVIAVPGVTRRSLASRRVTWLHRPSPRPRTRWPHVRRPRRRCDGRPMRACRCAGPRRSAP